MLDSKHHCGCNLTTGNKKERKKRSEQLERERERERERESISFKLGYQASDNWQTVKDRRLF